MGSFGLWSLLYSFNFQIRQNRTENQYFSWKWTTKLHETLDYWSRDMFNFDFLGKGQRIVSPPYFENEHYFPEKVFSICLWWSSHHSLCLLHVLFNVFRLFFSWTSHTFPEAVVWRCSVKKVFLNISQNSHGNTCAKKETLAQGFSCEFCQIFKNTFFIEDHCWLLLPFICTCLASRWLFLDESSWIVHGTLWCVTFYAAVLMFNATCQCVFRNPPLHG